MTTTPLPPHVISTDHPNHPSEGWSIAEMVWIDARDKIFQAYATQARADLEAEVARLREALEELLRHFTRSPSSLADSETRIKAHAALEKQQ